MYESPVLSPNNSEIWGNPHHLFSCHTSLPRSPAHCTFLRCGARELATFNSRISCSVLQTYDRPCLSLDNSEIWRVTPVIFSMAIFSDLSVVRYKHFPCRVNPSPTGAPEHARFNKMQHIQQPPFAEL